MRCVAVAANCNVRIALSEQPAVLGGLIFCILIRAQIIGLHLDGVGVAACAEFGDLRALGCALKESFKGMSGSRVKRRGVAAVTLDARHIGCRVNALEILNFDLAVADQTRVLFLRCLSECGKHHRYREKMKHSLTLANQ